MQYNNNIIGSDNIAVQISITDDLDSFDRTVDNVYQAIRSINADYHSQLEPISSTVSDLSFGD